MSNCLSLTSISCWPTIQGSNKDGFFLAPAHVMKGLHFISCEHSHADEGLFFLGEELGDFLGCSTSKFKKIALLNLSVLGLHVMSVLLQC